MFENNNMRRSLIYIAADCLRGFGGHNLTREQATALLPLWPHVESLSDDMRVEVLSHFRLDEPLMVPGVNWLPDPMCNCRHPKSDHFGLELICGGMANDGDVDHCCACARFEPLVEVAADAAVLVAEAVAELLCPNCQHPERRHRKGWGCVGNAEVGTCPCMVEPLVEVTAQPTAEAVQP